MKPYIGERSINYPIVIGNENVAQRFGGVDSLPTTLLLDRDGKIAGRHVGLVSKGTYQEEIGRLLKN